MRHIALLIKQGLSSLLEEQPDATVKLSTRLEKLYSAVILIDLLLVTQHGLFTPADR